MNERFDFNNIENVIKAYEELRKHRYKNIIDKIEPEYFFNTCDTFLREYRKLEQESKKYLIKLTDEEYRRVVENAQKDCISKSKIKEIRDKAEVMDYYTLPNVIDDLNELLGENNHCICTKCTNKECVHHKCKMDCVFDAKDSYECCDGFLKKGDCSGFIESEEYNE